MKINQLKRDQGMAAIRRGFVYWIGLSIALFPLSVFSQTYMDYDGVFNVTWSVSNTYNGGIFSHVTVRQTSPTSMTVGGGSSTSGQTANLTRPNGTYIFNIESCYTFNSPPVCHVDTTKTYIVSILTAPPANPPATFTVPATDADGIYTISWSTTADTETYEIQERVNGGPWSTLRNTSGTSMIFSGGTAKSNGSYGYQVRSCNSLGCSNYSAAKSTDVAIAPGVPASINVSPNPSTGNVTVSWGAATGSITQYDLDYQLGGGSWTHAYNGSLLSAGLANLAAGNYNIQVRACKTTVSYTNCSGWRTGTFTVMLPPPTPAGLTSPVSDSDGDFAVSWNTASTATSYELQESTNGGSTWNTIQNTSAISRNFTGATAKGNGSYSYRVRACNSVGCSNYTAIAPGVPANLGLTLGSDGVSISSVSWSVASGSVSSYRLQRRINGGGWGQVYSGAALTAGPFTGLSAGAHEYQVQACKITGGYTNCSAWSGSFTGYVPGVNGGVPVDSDAYTLVNITSLTANTQYIDFDGILTLSWSNDTAQNYSYTVIQAGQSAATYGTGSGTSKSLSNLADGLYIFSVNKCWTFSTQGGPVTQCIPHTTPVQVLVQKIPNNSPANFTVPATDGDGSYAISWSTVADAASYELQESINGGTWSTIQNTGATSKSFSGATAKGNGSYSYQVRACNAVGMCSGYTAVKTTHVALAPGVPASINIIPDSNTGNVAVNWGAASGSITKYDLDYQPSGGDWIPGYDGLALSANLSGLVAGNYNARVRACKTTGSYTNCSGWRTASFTIEPDCAGADCYINTPPAPDLSISIPATSGSIDQTLSMEGKFDVSSGGQATYEISILTAKGAGGFEPNISLRYNSGAGNGVAGWGWSIGGLGSISRCRQTEGHDKNAAPITWTAQDRFCLNGERLMVVSGVYGAPGSTYRTEIESYARITAVGGTAGHPDYFKMERKDGRVDFYGSNMEGTAGSNNAKHRFDAANSKTYSWLLSRQQDSTSHVDGLGNSITYSYYNSGFGVMPRILGIVYSGGGLYFDWQSRQDKTRGYIAGYEYWNDYRLNYIEVSSDSDTIRGYKLHYEDLYEEPYYADRVSRLVSIDHCNEADSINMICGRRTYLHWTIPTLAPQFDHANVTSVNMFYSPKKHTMGDIDGDGLPDVVWTDGSQVRYSIASINSNGQLQYTQTPFAGGGSIPASAHSATKIWMIDYNADGRQDLVVKEGMSHHGFTPGSRVYLSTPQTGGWALSSTPSYENFIPQEFFHPLFVDINGDGLQDIIDTYIKKVSVHKKDSYGQYFPMQEIQFVHPPGIQPCGTHAWNLEMHSQTGDFNGDGRVDFIAALNACNDQGQQQFYHTVVYTSHSVPNGGLELRYFDTLFDYVEDTLWDSDGRELLAYLRVSDFNNDGLSDVINGKGGWTFQYRLSTSTGFGALQTVPGVAYMAYTGVVDMNGDGYPDLASYRNNLSHSYQVDIRHWDPQINAFSPQIISQASPHYLYGYYTTFRFTDMNGDGIMDMVALSESPQNSMVVVPGRPGDLLRPHTNKIHAIGESEGEAISIRYENLGRSKHYSYIKGVNTTVQQQVCQTTAVGNACWNREVAAATSMAFYNIINNPFAGSNQTLESPLIHRVFNINSSIPVVTEVSRNIPVANPNSPSNITPYYDYVPVASYYYEQARMQASGRGFLGFKKVTEVDRRSGVRTITDYRQDWPFNGQPLNVLQYSAENKILLHNSYTWGFADCYTSGGSVANCASNKRSAMVANGIQGVGSIQPFLRGSTERRFTPDTGWYISTIIKSSRQDSKGNAVVQDEMIWSGDMEETVLSKTTTNQYDYTGPSWSMQQGRLSHMTTAHNNNEGSITRQSSFTYYTSGRQAGLVHTEVLEPNSAYTQTTTHTYDNFGNRVQSIVTGGGLTRYGPRLEYDSVGRYVDRVYERFNNGSGGNVERLVSSVVARDSYGNPIQTRRYLNTSNYVTEWTGVTIMGVPVRSSDSSGAWTVTGGGMGAGNSGVCLAGLTDTHQHIRTAGGGERVLCFDVRKRNIREATRLFNGSWSQVDTEYDALDRIVRVSEPYIQGQNRYWTEHKNRDVLGRIRRIEHPDYPSTGAVTTFEYHWDHNAITNPLGQTQLEYKNVLGQITRTVDPMGGNTWFTHDPRGNLVQMRDPANNTTTISYDLLDRKISMNDPDKGLWTYQYNQVGELTCQRDAKGQVIKHGYDFRGRLISRQDYTGGTCANPAGALESNSTWVYDTATYGLGQIRIVSDSVSGYEKEITYDAFGRPSVNRTRIPGVSSQLENHYEKITYDQHSRIFQSFDAARVNDTFDRNGIQYVYTASGHLHKLADVLHFNGQPLKTYYEVEAMDARGNVTEATYGNGVMQFAGHDPATGRVTDIWASNGGSIPIQDLSLTWDVAGNLTSRHETGLGLNASTARNLQESFSYDASNRLIQHQLGGDASGTFNINYNAIGNITFKTGVGSYSYNPSGSGSVRPHAVTTINGNGGYVYDANGSMTGGDGRGITYTVPDLPHTIGKGGHTSIFSYGPDRARYKRVDTAGSNATATLYLGSVEKVYHANGSIHWKRSIGGVALITQTVNSAGSILGQSTRYFHKDHLGSINLITSEVGDVTEVLDFDPWGKRRHTQTWQLLSQAAKLLQFGIFAPPATTRGYTGHEMLDETGLIHMNGRIYDDALARFVQADPIIQDPFRSQSLNRYSYVWNNPLNATDPSGFCRSSMYSECEYRSGREQPRTPDRDLDERSWGGRDKDPFDDRDVEPMQLIWDAMDSAAEEKKSRNSFDNGSKGTHLTAEKKPDTVVNQDARKTPASVRTEKGPNERMGQCPSGPCEEVVVIGRKTSNDSFRRVPGFHGYGSRGGPVDLTMAELNSEFSRLQDLRRSIQVGQSPFVIDTTKGQGPVLIVIGAAIVAPFAAEGAVTYAPIAWKAMGGPKAAVWWNGLSPQAKRLFRAKVMEIFIENSNWPFPGRPSGTGEPQIPYRPSNPEDPSPIIQIK
jgi:RHS repeat-associated protein